MTVSKPRVVVTHWVHPEVAEYLAEFSDALIPSRDEGVFPPGRVADLAAGADALIACMADRLDDEFLARCPRLRVVSATLKGYDNFDAGACARRGIWLTVVPDTNDERRLDARTEERLSVCWQSLEQLAEVSDVLIAALPLTSRTRHLIGSNLIRRSRPGAFVVNVGRGSVVDEDAIADALDCGHLGGYAADVFAMEDWMLPGHPPAIPHRLLSHPRTLFTPHLGSAVDDVRRLMSLEAARQVRQVLDGSRPDHAVNAPEHPEPWPGCPDDVGGAGREATRG